MEGVDYWKRLIHCNKAMLFIFTKDLPVNSTHSTCGATITERHYDCELPSLSSCFISRRIETLTINPLAEFPKILQNSLSSININQSNFPLSEMASHLYMLKEQRIASAADNWSPRNDKACMSVNLPHAKGRPCVRATWQKTSFV